MLVDIDVLCSTLAIKYKFVLYYNSSIYRPICSAMLMKRWENIDSWIVSSSVPTKPVVDVLPTLITISPCLVILAWHWGSTHIVLKTKGITAVT